MGNGESRGACIVPTSIPVRDAHIPRAVTVPAFVENAACLRERRFFFYTSPGARIDPTHKQHGVHSERNDPTRLNGSAAYFGWHMISCTKMEMLPRKDSPVVKSGFVPTVA